MLANLKSDSSVLSSFEYSYDGAGNRTSLLEDAGDRVTWTYDTAYQLTAEHRSGSKAFSHTFTYDAAGNRLSMDDGTTLSTMTYAEGNRLATLEDSTGVTTYTFDADGNQQVVFAPGGDRTTYVWDYENQNTLVRQPAGGLVTMAYNADLLRVAKQSDAGTSKYVWSNAAYLLETDGVSSRVRIGHVFAG